VSKIRKEKNKGAISAIKDIFPSWKSLKRLLLIAFEILLPILIITFTVLYVNLQKLEVPFHYKQLLKSTTQIMLLVEGVPITSGTGVSIAQEEEHSYILTVDHICEYQKEQIDIGMQVISFDGIRYHADIVSRSPKDDLCLLKIDASIPKVKVYQKNLQFADPVIGIGAPLGMFPMPSHGNFSYYDTYDNRYFLSFPIAPGFSGGPILFKNRLVGIVSQTVDRYESFCLAIPAPTVQEFLDNYFNDVRTE